MRSRADKSLFTAAALAAAVIFAASAYVRVAVAEDAKTGVRKSSSADASFSSPTAYFDLPAQSLADSLRAVGRQADINILINQALIGDRQAPALKARLTVSEALAQLLQGTGLVPRFVDDKTVVLAAENSAANTAEAVIPSAVPVHESTGRTSIHPDHSTGQRLAQARDDNRGMSVADGSKDVDDKNRNKRESLQEIVVTAQKRSERLQDVPMAVTAVRPDDFISVGLTRLSDVIAYTPGVSARQIPEPSGDQIYIRGIGQDVTPVVGIYLDSVPLSSNSPWGTGGQYPFDGLLGDLERVEFLKGPQGTLYGATSIAGAVKYITRKPALDTFRGYASVDYSGTQHGGNNEIYSGRISMPIIENKLGMTVAGFIADNGGVVDLVDGNGAVLKKDADAYTRRGFSGDIYYAASDTLEFRFKALHQKFEYEGISQMDIDAATRAPIYGAFEGNNGALDRSMENRIYSAAVEYRFKGATLTASGSYTKDLWLDRAELPQLVGLVDILMGRPPGTTTSISRGLVRGSERYTQEIQLASGSGGKWEWLVGVYHTDEDTKSDSKLTVQPGDVNWNTSTEPSSYKEYAVFGDLTYYITRKFDLSIGMRYSDNKMRYLPKQTSDVFPFVAPYINEVKDTVDTWSFAARYRPSQSWSLFARAANGYRPASANSLVTDGVFSLPLIVESDTLWSYELGAKGSVAQGLLSYDLALWYLKWDNFQTRLSLSPLVAGLGNAAGGITAKGVEGSFTIRPTNGLSIISTFTYANSTLNEDEPELSGSSGQQVPFVPRWVLSGLVRYDFPISSGIDGHFGLGVRYQDESRSAFTDAGAFVPGVSNPAAGGYDTIFNLPTDAYTAVDLNGGITWRGFSLNVYVNNLLGQDALLGTGGTYFGAAPMATAVPLRPRTIGATISFNL